MDTIELAPAAPFVCFRQTQHSLASWGAIKDPHEAWSFEDWGPTALPNCLIIRSSLEWGDADTYLEAENSFSTEFDIWKTSRNPMSPGVRECQAPDEVEEGERGFQEKPSL